MKNNNFSWTKIKMTRKDLAKKIAKNTPLTQREAENLIISFGAAIRNALVKGEKVIYSNFGTFYTVHYPSKVILHPKLGEKKKIIMLPTDAVKWMPSGTIKKMVNNKVTASDTDYGQETKKPQKTRVTNPVAPKKTSSEVEIPINKPGSVQKPAAEPENIYEKLMKEAANKESTTSTQSASPNNTSAKLDLAVKNHTSQDSLNQTQPEAPEPLAQPSGGFFSRFKFGNNIQTKKDSAPQSEQKPMPADYSNFAKTKTNISYIDLSNKIIPKEVLQRIPEKTAREYNIVPIEDNANEFVVAMVDPEDIESKEIARKLVGKKITAHLATLDDINHILDQYQGMESEVEDAIEKAGLEDDIEIEKKPDKTQVSAAVTDSAPAARIVNSLIRRSIRDKASDIHLEPTEKNLEVRFRVDGVLEKKVALPKEIQSAIITRIKILSNLKIDEQRLPQDGRFSVSVDNRRIDFRVSSMPVSFGEKIVMRVLDKASGILTLEQLGFKKEDMDVISESIKKPHGMILVTGPTGSGKTTTLYAMIDKIYTEGINIVTLEDPIEYQMPGINQSQINPTIGYTFANGLRSILRQDPDVIMIGEIRDTETAEMAVHSALTGHIVLSTLHTNNASGAIPRLIDMNVEPFLLTSSLNVIIAQRLVRKICEECKEEVKLPAEQLDKIKKEIEAMPAQFKKSIPNELKFFQGKGCKACNDSGYKGRLGLYEVLNVSNEVKNLITSRASSDKILQTAVSEGMTSMLQDGILKALAGTTSMSEVLKATKE